MKEYLTIKEAIKIYNKSDSTIRRMLRQMTEYDKDKYIVRSGNRNLISSLYLDTIYKPRKAVLQDQSNDIVKLVNVTDRIVALNELMTESDSPINKALKAIEKTAKKYDNMTYAMLLYVEEQKIVIENQNKIIDRLLTVTSIKQQEGREKLKKKSKKIKEGKLRKKKNKTRKNKRKVGKVK